MLHRSGKGIGKNKRMASGGSAHSEAATLRGGRLRRFSTGPYSATLEGSGDGEPEGFAGLAQQEGGGVGVDGEVIGIVAGGGVGEHGAGDRDGRNRGVVQAQRIVGPVDAEGRVDDGQEHLKFESGGHSRLPVGRS